MADRKTILELITAGIEDPSSLPEIGEWLASGRFVNIDDVTKWDSPTPNDLSSMVNFLVRIIARNASQLDLESQDVLNNIKTVEDLFEYLKTCVQKNENFEQNLLTTTKKLSTKEVGCKVGKTKNIP